MVHTFVSMDSNYNIIFKERHIAEKALLEKEHATEETELREQLELSLKRIEIRKSSSAA